MRPQKLARLTQALVSLASSATPVSQFLGADQSLSEALGLDLASSKLGLILSHFSAATRNI